MLGGLADPIEGVVPLVSGQWGCPGGGRGAACSGGLGRAWAVSEVGQVVSFCCCLSAMHKTAGCCGRTELRFQNSF